MVNINVRLWCYCKHFFTLYIYIYILNISNNYYKKFNWQRKGWKLPTRKKKIRIVLFLPFHLTFAGWTIPPGHRAGLRDPRSLCPVPPHPHCHRGPHCHPGAAAALGQGALQPQPPGGQSDPDKTQQEWEAGARLTERQLAWYSP